MTIDAPSPPRTDLFKRIDRVAPPLSPGAEALTAYRRGLGDPARPLLLLGMTRPLAESFAPDVAIDWSTRMIEKLWDRRSGTAAVQGDWRTLPFADAQFGSVMGDGAANMLHWPDGWLTLAAELDRVLMPGGKAVLRCFTRAESGCDVQSRLSSETNFHALKWRMAGLLAEAGGSPNLAMHRLSPAFDTLFPDREALAMATGWDRGLIDEIDTYRESAISMSFPTLAEIQSLFPRARLSASGNYPLAERCPMLEWQVPR